jgi:hypothetical protein
VSRGPWISKGFPVSARWSHVKGKKYWDQGMPVAEMASRLATSPQSIKNAVVRWGWTPRRKYKKRVKVNSHHLFMPELVTRRCPECLAPYEGPRNTANPVHEGCRRMAA